MLSRRFAVALVTSTTTSVFAWTSSSSSSSSHHLRHFSATTSFVVGEKERRNVLGQHRSSLLLNTLSPPPSLTSTATRMFNLFGGGGGGGGAGSQQKSKIDYVALDHPGPELAAMAESGQPMPAVSTRDPHLALATFAGGCFWGLELAYQRLPGVEYTAVGYTQGPETYPTYSQVCSGSTGHTEAVMVYYNPSQVSFEALLDTFFSRVNPYTVNGQGNDFGRQNRTGVYFHSPEQQSVAEARFAREQEKNNNRKLATELKSAEPFWPAEKYHQQYLEKGGRLGSPQNASKGATEPIRCYG